MTDCVIVTGAGSGIGKAIAQHFLKPSFKYHILATDILSQSLEALKETSSMQMRDTLSTAVCDVRNEKEVEELFAKCSQIGHLVAVVHVAGIMPQVKATTETTVEEYEKIIGVNFKGTFLINRAAVSTFKKQGSDLAPPGGYSIVNFSSGLASMGAPMAALYSASKGAISSFSRSLAAEVAPANIRVNVVAPGPISTPLFHNNGLPSQIIAQGRPMARLGSADEMNGIVEYLLAPSASYTTGAVFDINGGAP